MFKWSVISPKQIIEKAQKLNQIRTKPFLTHQSSHDPSDSSDFPVHETVFFSFFFPIFSWFIVTCFLCSPLWTTKVPGWLMPVVLGQWPRQLQPASRRLLPSLLASCFSSRGLAIVSSLRFHFENKEMCCEVCGFCVGIWTQLVCNGSYLRSKWHPLKSCQEHQLTRALCPSSVWALKAFKCPKKSAC